MKRNLILPCTALVVAIASLILALSVSPAQPPVAGPPAVQPVQVAGKTYYKGRVALKPDAADWLRKIKHQKFYQRLKALQAVAPPASWDSRTLGIISPVWDQAACGSCWAFSGTFTAQVALNKAGVLKSDGTQDLSTQYTLDCYSNGGCNGDDNVTVLQHAKDTGLPLTSAYGAYHARAGKCNTAGATTLYKIDDWGYADSNGGNGVTADGDIQRAIMTYGAVGCAVAADNAFSNWTGDQTTPFAGSGSRSIDHDVAIVGWVTDAKGVIWCMRNSWGDSWGQNGYMWIRSGANLIGTEAVFATKASVNPPVPPTPPIPPVTAIMSLDFSRGGYGPNQNVTFNTGPYTIPSVKVNLVPVAAKEPEGKPPHPHPIPGPPCCP
jgi:hypothetical protein